MRVEGEDDDWCFVDVVLWGVVVCEWCGKNMCKCDDDWWLMWWMCVGIGEECRKINGERYCDVEA